MSVGSILLGLALLLLVALFVSRPLLSSRKVRKRRATTYEGLLAQKEAVLTQIRALDFDYETGKVPEQDYQEQRAVFFAEATEILKQLDEMEGRSVVAEPTTAAVEDDGTTDIDADIEAAVTLLRQKGSKPSPAVEEVATAGSGGTGKNGKTNYCSQCGRQADPEDKFCAHCGHQLREPQHA